jgi:ubiquinone/menaquinone biosynthesis C-methylase UbiE
MTDKAKKFEQTYVHDIYENIAKQFDNTRVNIWQQTKIIFDDLCSESNKDKKIIDVGCGNGRNMNYLISQGCTQVFGCDTCKHFVDICKEKNLSVVEGNILNIPYSDNSFDMCISIAVIHHLSTKERRLKAIQELIRIVQVNGKILIQVWAKEQHFSKVKYIEQDVFISWKTPKKDILGERFYHLFVEQELEELCLENKNIEIVYSYYDHDNYGILLIKKF